MNLANKSASLAHGVMMEVVAPAVLTAAIDTLPAASEVPTTAGLVMKTPACEPGQAMQVEGKIRQ